MYLILCGFFFVNMHWMMSVYPWLCCCRRGKKKVFTLVRLIRVFSFFSLFFTRFVFFQGDTEALKHQLELLVRQPFEVKNGYIRTKGHKKRQIVEWLHQIGF